METTYKPHELENYDFGNVTAPEGFDPDASGAVDPPIGKSVFEVSAWSDEKPAFEVKPDHTFRWDGQQYTLNQIRVRFRIPKGFPFAGAGVMVFLPLPSPGVFMPVGLANQWANFIKSLGFDLPKDRLVPDGFTLGKLAGRRCVIDIEQGVDENRQPKVRPNGKPQLAPAFFGFSRVDPVTGGVPGGTSNPAPSGKSAPAKSTNNAQPTGHPVGAGAPGSTGNFDL